MDTEQLSAKVELKTTRLIRVFAAYSSQTYLTVATSEMKVYAQLIGECAFFSRLLPEVSRLVFVRLLWLTKAMTSNNNSNPSNSLVINKAHIVAEGGKG